jgi:quercetin dioxygenase-like cupin family protein
MNRKGEPGVSEEREITRHESIGTRLAAPGWTLVRIDEVENVAAKRDPSGSRDIRFPAGKLGLSQIGLSRQVLAPGTRLPFGHRHSHAEEVLYVLSGSGRARLNEELVEIKAGDVIRLGPEVMRGYEAGDDGIEVLIFGQNMDEDESHLDREWWSD